MFKEFSELEKISIGGCNLRKLPKEILNLSNLKEINISENPNLDFKETFFLLSKINTLKTLRSSYGNHEGTLFKEIGLLTQLENLFLEGNNIIILPSEIKYLINLKGLSYIL